MSKLITLASGTFVASSALWFSKRLSNLYISSHCVLREPTDQKHAIYRKWAKWMSCVSESQRS